MEKYKYKSVYRGSTAIREGIRTLDIGCEPIGKFGGSTKVTNEPKTIPLMHKFKLQASCHL